jgi:hypothetical protein
MEVSFFQNFMGGLVSSFPSLFKKLGNLETSLANEYISEKKVDRPIFISGLARSGSTILLELLSSHPETTSHQYKDFPLIHIPIWWNNFLKRAGQKVSHATDRAHKDRIKITPDSPEAMEEILWMSFFAGCHDPRVNNILTKMNSSSEFDSFYNDHILKLLHVKGGSRYLSKGNYNVSRIEYISQLFPEAVFLIPIREPANHIASLIKQHKLFCELETQNPKILSYMQRAGHFEFGLDRRPINFGEDSINKIQEYWAEGQEVSGWGATWSSVYSYVADLYENNSGLSKQIKIVSYESFCKNPLTILRDIYKHCDLDIHDEDLKKQSELISFPDYYQSNFSDIESDIIHQETNSTYERIQALIKTSG